jgi:cytochrome P450
MTTEGTLTSSADEPLAFPFPADSLYHPAPEWAQLRETCPVAHGPTPDGGTALLVSRHGDIRSLMVDPRYSRAAAADAAAKAGQGGIAAAAGVDSILGMDGEEHARLRRLVAGAFTVHRIEKMRLDVRATVHELLDRLQALPQPVDLVGNFSFALPFTVLCKLIGVPPEDYEVLRSSTDAVMGDEMTDPEQSVASLKRLVAYFADLIDRRRNQPADDLITALVQARDNEDRLTEHELRMLCLGVMIAGYESTANEINMFVLNLMHYRDEWDRLKAEPELVPQAVEELLRFCQLTEIGIGLPRVTTEDVELSGCPIPAGTAVLPALNTAGRDADVFGDPDRIDFTRQPNPHYGFGAGIHRCLGAPLARLELQEALRAMIERLPEMRLAVTEAELPFTPGRVVRSLEALPITW